MYFQNHYITIGLMMDLHNENWSLSKACTAAKQDRTKVQLGIDVSKKGPAL